MKNQTVFVMDDQLELTPRPSIPQISRIIVASIPVQDRRGILYTLALISMRAGFTPEI